MGFRRGGGGWKVGGCYRRQLEGPGKSFEGCSKDDLGGNHPLLTPFLSSLILAPFFYSIGTFRSTEFSSSRPRTPPAPPTTPLLSICRFGGADCNSAMAAGTAWLTPDRSTLTLAAPSSNPLWRNNKIPGITYSKSMAPFFRARNRPGRGAGLVGGAPPPAPSATPYGGNVRA